MPKILSCLVLCWLTASMTARAGTEGIEIRSGTWRLRISALADDIIRVRANPGNSSPEDASWAVAQDLRRHYVPVNAIETPDSVEFSTASMKVHVERSSLRIVVSDLSGHVITADSAAQALEQRLDGFLLRKALTQKEHIFGLGDKSGPLDRRGEAFTLWNTDAYRFQESTDPLYKSIPFFLSAGGPGGSYGIFLDNTWRSWFDFGKRDPQTLSFGAAGGAIDYYLIYGPSVHRVVERYTDLTGKPPMVPAWALGFQQSRYSYMSAAEVRAIAERLRSVKIPSDVIWLDIDFQDRNRPFTVNTDAFPDLAGLARELRAQGLRLVTITDLHIAAAPHEHYLPYDSGVAGDHFLRNPDGSLYVGKVWPGPSVFPDFTRQATRLWWGSLYREFVAAGVAGFWNDMNEPSIFESPSLTMPLDIQHRIAEPGFLERSAGHAEIHNVYGMLNSRATFEGQRQLAPDERSFVMTRASYAGGQRYAATWTGDNSSSWSHLKLSISMLLNLGMSGFAYSGADVGGFIGAPTPDLMTRWVEIAAFTPLFRAHSEKGTPPKELWVDGDEQLGIRRQFVEQRYRLLPYFYALADENAQTGAPLMRPLFYDFPDALDMPCNQPTAFMLGNRLLVAPPPTLESPQSYSVCLPAGHWYDYWTGEPVVTQPDATLSSARTISIVPSLERLPVFVRAGAIIPSQTLIQSTSEIARGALFLDIYPGEDCHGTIYADDGHSMAYTQQSFLRQKVRCTQSLAGLDVDFERREGAYQPAWHQVRVRVHHLANGVHALLNGKLLPVLAEREAVQTVTLDAPDRKAHLSFRTN
jgi:alpha-glucosidase